MDGIEILAGVCYRTGVIASTVDIEETWASSGGLGGILPPCVAIVPVQNTCSAHHRDKNAAVNDLRQ